MDDRLFGDDTDNVFFAGRGNDLVEGGAGTDTLRVDGDIFEWTFVLANDGTLIMTHPTWGENTLTGVEQILAMRSGETFTIEEALQATDQLPVFRIDNDNVLNGTNGNDNMVGASDGTSFYGGLGNDFYTGSDTGFDQVNFDGVRSEYTFTQNADGTVTADHPIWGTDTFAGIEALIFTGVEPGVGGARSGDFEFILVDDLFIG